MAHRRYIHVFHSCNLFDEIIACYRAAMDRLKWMSVCTWQEWSAKRPEWQDPNNVIILWWWNTPGLLNVVPPQREAAFALWYGESVGPPEKMSLHQGGILTKFLGYLKIPDTVFVGSPSAAQFLRPYCRKAAHAPIGYDPKIMGEPNWAQSKEYDFGYCGFPIGRREWILPALRHRFGKRLFEFFGPFWKDRKQIYDQCRAILYIPHSEEPSLPGMRIWQCIASSAPLITEKRDGWPAVAGRHYVELPEAKETDLDGFTDKVEQTLKLPLEEIARRAYTELSGYTVDRAMEYITAAI